MKAIMISNGKLYEMGASLMWREIPLDGKYLNKNGTVSTKTVSACIVGLMDRYNLLTLIPDDDERAVQWRLGGNAYESVKPEARGRITGDYRGMEPEAGDSFVSHDGEIIDADIWTHRNVIILSPPPPEPKMTDREALVEIQTRLQGMKAVVATREFLDKHLADTE